MTEATKSSKSPNRTRKWLVTAAIAGGVAIGATGIAGAVSSTTTPAAKSGAATAVPSQGNEDTTHEKGESAQREADDKAGKANFGGHGDHGGRGDHGGAETVVTGADADKANAAALASVPGKVSKTEKRADGTYEVEITKADGTEVHVMLDAAFKVTGQGGHGGNGHGGHGRHHDGNDTDGGTATTTAAGAAN